MKAVLEDIRVIDLSRHMSGPYAGAILADFGADVIRVERPGGDEDRHFGHEAPSGDTWSFANRTRNKRAITVNLKHPDGRKIMEQLIKHSDVVLENFAMRDKEKLGFDYETLKKINPRIILASISAFGLTGPNVERVGFDPVAQAESGAMSFNGFPGTPPTRAAVPWVDYSTAIHTAFGIVSAIRHRDRTGKGQVLDVCLADVAAALVAVHGIYTEYEKEGLERPQMGNRSPYAYANTFEAKDGWVFISLTREGIWKRFLKAADMESLADDLRFNSDESRARHSNVLDKTIAPWIHKHSGKEVIEILEKAFVPCALVNTIQQAFNEKQIWDREILVNMEHEQNGKMATLGVVVKCSETPGTIRRGMPLVGQHNKEILKDLLGFKDDDLKKFIQEGAI